MISNPTAEESGKKRVYPPILPVFFMDWGVGSNVVREPLFYHITSRYILDWHNYTRECIWIDEL